MMDVVAMLFQVLAKWFNIFFQIVARVLLGG